MISVTALSGYLYCPRKLYLERVLGMEEVPKEAVVIGTVKHSIYDYINKEEKSIITGVRKLADLEGIGEIYRRRYSKLLRRIIREKKSLLKTVSLGPSTIFKRIWPLVLHESETRSENICIFVKEHNIFGEELWEKLTPKIESEKRVRSERLQLRGIVDQVETTNEEIIPVELKTGKAPSEGVWPGHKVQVGAYAMLLSENTGREVAYGKVKYLDVGGTRTIPVNPFLEEEIISIRKNVQELLESKKAPPPCSNSNKCLRCGLRRECSSILLAKNQKKRLQNA